MKLCIAIPTFNRTPQLRATVEALLPQLTPDCELLILDNASDEPASQALADLLTRSPYAQIRLHRNIANVGANANVLRAFELSNTEWLWVLGDDDEILASAVSTVLSVVAQHPNASFINFSSGNFRRSNIRSAPFVTRGIDEFVDKLDAAHQLNFMSCGVWRTCAFRPWLSKAYHYGYSMSHSFVLLLSALQADRNKECVFSEREVIGESTLVEHAKRWSYIDFALGFNTVLELRLHAAHRRKLARKLLNWHSPENVAAFALLGTPSLGAEERRFLYKLLVHRLWPHQTSAFRVLRFLIYRVLFVLPTAGERVVKASIAAAVRLGFKRVDVDDLSRRARG